MNRPDLNRRRGARLKRPCANYSNSCNSLAILCNAPAKVIPGQSHRAGQKGALAEARAVPKKLIAANYTLPVWQLSGVGVRPDIEQPSFRFLLS